jgi:hypothetical protein
VGWAQSAFIIYKGMSSEFIMEMFLPSPKAGSRQAQAKTFLAWSVVSGNRGKRCCRSGRGLEMEKVQENGSRKSFLLL